VTLGSIFRHSGAVMPVLQRRKKTPSSMYNDDGSKKPQQDAPPGGERRQPFVRALNSGACHFMP
jgi:hypothetical protein